MRKDCHRVGDGVGERGPWRVEPRGCMPLPEPMVVVICELGMHCAAVLTPFAASHCAIVWNTQFAMPDVLLRQIGAA